MLLQEKQDNFVMKKALELAKKANALCEVPVGAVIVDSEGEIIGRGYNLVEKKKSQLAHAELLAISKAVKKIGNWRLDGCSIYITLEPCSMCFCALGLSRISRIVYGADSPLFGYHLDRCEDLNIYKKHIKEIVSGIGKETSIKLLKRFFEKYRGENNG